MFGKNTQTSPSSATSSDPFHRVRSFSSLMYEEALKCGVLKSPILRPIKPSVESPTPLELPPAEEPGEESFDDSLDEQGPAQHERQAPRVDKRVDWCTRVPETTWIHLSPQSTVARTT